MEQPRECHVTPEITVSWTKMEWRRYTFVFVVAVLAWIGRSNMSNATAIDCIKCWGGPGVAKCNSPARCVQLMNSVNINVIEVYSCSVKLMTREGMALKNQDITIREKSGKICESKFFSTFKKTFLLGDTESNDYCRVMLHIPNVPFWRECN